MEIKSISEKIFRTSTNRNENCSNHTNPFGVSFKGNMISADVFETAAKKSKLAEGVTNLRQGLSERMGKLQAAVNISAMSESLNRRLDSIVSFGKRIGESVNRAWNYLNNTNLVINIDTAERVSKEFFKIDLASESRYRVKNLLDHKEPEKTLRPMFEEIVAIAEGV